MPLCQGDMHTDKYTGYIPQACVLIYILISENILLQQIKLNYPISHNFIAQYWSPHKETPLIGGECKNFQAYFVISQRGRS